jgi:Ca2+-binding RTX toxin-like protein
VENVSNAAITASAGDHLIFIGGTGNTLTATGGTETVQAFQGGNTITTGAGNDKIYFSGSNNVVNAGAGNNALYDSGTNNTIVLPAANQGYDDIYGYMMTNGDKFDMRGLLASTSWNGDLATIGNYVAVTPSGTGSVIQVDPSGVAGGASYVAATLEAAGPVSLSTLLAHAIT